MRSRVLVILAGLFAAACGEDHGAIRGQHLVVADCGEDGSREFAPFHMEFDVFAYESLRGPLYIRMQRSGEPLTGGDGFAVHVRDVGALREALAAAPEGVPLGGEDALVDASLLLAHTCPRSYQPLVAEGGRIVFHELGDGNGERVRFEIADFALRDLREDVVVGTGFSGEADFEIRGRPPYVTFSE